jgi:hypothetical protein
MHIHMPNLVVDHLVQHKQPETGEWTCTSCGKQYLRGRWGYGMLLMHMQGRGDDACGGIVDLRTQYATMFKVERLSSTLEVVANNKDRSCSPDKEPKF